MFIFETVETFTSWDQQVFFVCVYVFVCLVGFFFFFGGGLYIYIFNTLFL